MSCHTSRDTRRAYQSTPTSSACTLTFTSDSGCNVFDGDLPTLGYQHAGGMVSDMCLPRALSYSDASLEEIACRTLPVQHTIPSTMTSRTTRLSSINNKINSFRVADAYNKRQLIIRGLLSRR
jgi:hypothetical protein